jgi:hypothetical protein
MKREPLPLRLGDFVFHIDGFLINGEAANETPQKSPLLRYRAFGRPCPSVAVKSV